MGNQGESHATQRSTVIADKAWNFPTLLHRHISMMTSMKKRLSATPTLLGNSPFIAAAPQPPKEIDTPYALHGGVPYYEVHFLVVHMGGHAPHR